MQNNRGVVLVVDRVEPRELRQRGVGRHDLLEPALVERHKVGEAALDLHRLSAHAVHLDYVQDEVAFKVALALHAPRARHGAALDARRVVVSPRAPRAA